MWPLAAAAWGFGEATVLMIVPDVLLTLAVIKLGFRRAIPIALCCLVGALCGGAIMHRWGASNPEQARAFLDIIPAISRQMIDSVAAGAGENYPTDMVRGSLTGIPYKVFAVTAGAEGIALPTFLAISAGARLVRWLTLMALTVGIVAIIRRRGSTPHAQTLWLMLWVSFYLFYFSFMPN